MVPGRLRPDRLGHHGRAGALDHRGGDHRLWRMPAGDGHPAPAVRAEAAGSAADPRHRRDRAVPAVLGAPAGGAADLLPGADRERPHARAVSGCGRHAAEAAGLGAHRRAAHHGAAEPCPGHRLAARRPGEPVVAGAAAARGGDLVAHHRDRAAARPVGGVDLRDRRRRLPRGRPAGHHRRRGCRRQAADHAAAEPVRPHLPRHAGIARALSGARCPRPSLQPDRALAGLDAGGADRGGGAAAPLGHRRAGLVPRRLRGRAAGLGAEFDRGRGGHRDCGVGDDERAGRPQDRAAVA